MMKKFASIALLAACGALASTSALADSWGIRAGVDMLNTHSSGSIEQGGNTYNPDYDSNFRPGFYASLEHSIPLLPDVMIRYQNIDAAGSSNGTYIKNDQTMFDTVLYYQLFDNPAFGIDWGLNFKNFSGTVTGIGGSRDYNKTLPTFYLAGNVNIPMTGIEAFGNTSNVHYSGNHVTDTMVGLSYTINPYMPTSVQVRLGYRYVDSRLDDVASMNIDQKTHGWFLGVGIHI